MAAHFLLLAKAFFTVRHFTKKHRLKKHCRDMLAGIDLNRAKNLMLVTRPGEEALWGGGHLLEEDYLVVCMTGGAHPETAAEMDRALSASPSQSMKFAFREKNLRGKSSHWYFARSDIKTVLKMLFTAKEWNKIVTHNPDGEYGNRQNKLLSTIVTQVFNKTVRKKSPKNDNLFYFGRYCRPAETGKPEGLAPLSETAMAAKTEMLAAYKTLSSPEADFGHMLPYENWVKHSDWT